jgi:ADP-ribose pyrophosphatase
MTAEGDPGPGDGAVSRPLRTDISDRPERWPVLTSTVRFAGSFITVVTNTVRLPDGGLIQRDVVRHPGAVGVLPYDETAGAVLLLQQYRHAPGMLLWEPPAGLRDLPGEPPLETAKRELYEEAHLRAERWSVLVEAYNSPGITTETLLIYVARELTEVAEADRYNSEHEEAYLVRAWVPLDDAVRLVLDRDLHNPTTVMGILALEAALRRRGGLDSLRAGD